MPENIIPDPLKASHVRQQMAQIKSGVSQGERMLIDDLKSGGKLQVSTGERDERGGVIFREATEQDMKRLFSKRIDAGLPSLPGLDTQDINKQATNERNFMQNRMTTMSSHMQPVTMNIQFAGRDLQHHIAELDDEDSIGGGV